MSCLIAVGHYYHERISTEALEAMLARFGLFAPLGFILIYAIATVSFIPGSVLTLSGGFIFGPLYGTIYNLSGAVIGATIAFLIARYTAGDWVAKRTGGRLKQLIEGVEKEGWRFIAVVRLIPLFPFNLLNYALGLTQVSLATYVIASAIFMLPGAAAYTYVGSLGRSALAGETEKIVNQALIAVGLLVLLAVIPWLIKRFRS